MSGQELIEKERLRQAEELGYTVEHFMFNPELYGKGQLAEAAAYYAFTEEQRTFTDGILASFNDGEGNSVWPWEPSYFNASPEDRIKELTKAGALIVAEINRLQRLKK